MLVESHDFALTLSDVRTLGPSFMPLPLQPILPLTSPPLTPVPWQAADQLTMDMEEILTLSDVGDLGPSTLSPPSQPLSSLISPPTTILPHQEVDNIQMDVDMTILAPLEALVPLSPIKSVLELSPTEQPQVVVIPPTPHQSQDTPSVPLLPPSSDGANVGTASLAAESAPSHLAVLDAQMSLSPPLTLILINCPPLLIPYGIHPD